MTAIDWGSVPTWFSAIGTTGSLLATAGIIMRDRRKDQRTDAARVACWLEAPVAYEVSDDSVDLNQHRFLRVHNTADRPVFDLFAVIGPDSSATYIRFDLDHVVPAGAEATFLVPYEYQSAGPLPPPRPVAVEFRDVERTTWIYDLDAGTLHRRRKRHVQRVRSWLRIQQKFVSEFGWKAFNLRFRRRVALHKRPNWRR
ncbi:hypothetical protein GCM10018777_31550 [Streptomyces albogriseolus]|uniref:hypothetical protein n=1 Tax=Streptomyces TaxID=1883 RepID=UPI001675BD96|nr:hypothetical protein [Streptomyces viridodiastaticus]GHG15489.1 hypothetical protein GCM10018777_31550 [Streptomyces viridodiastaticus]